MSLIRRYAEFGHKDENVAVYWNSTVAIVSNVLQNFLLSVFFVILARSYGPTLFAQYVVANSLYQLIAVIAPFGLLSYFVREYSQRPDDRHDLLKDFFQIEFLLSLFGFATVVAIVLGLRYETEIVVLATILGINLFFDNFIYYIKSVNVAESRQFYSALPVIIEAILKILLGVALILLHLSLVQISIFLVGFRFITLFIALNFVRGTSALIPQRLREWVEIASKIRWKRLQNLLSYAKHFAVIGTISIIYWRINVLVLSKFVERSEVSYYEVGTRLFYILQMVPVTYLLSLYPYLAKAHKENVEKFLVLGRSALSDVTVFSLGIGVPCAILSPVIVSVLFGAQYAPAGPIGSIIMWTIVPFSIGNLQAYLLIASGNEKIDMWLNVFALSMDLLFLFLLIPTYKALGASYSIFISMCFFVLVQEFILARKRFHIWEGMLGKYLILLGIQMLPLLFSDTLSRYLCIGIVQLVFWFAVFRWKLVRLELLRRLVFRSA